MGIPNSTSHSDQQCLSRGFAPATTSPPAFPLHVTPNQSKSPDPKWRLPFPQQMQTDLLSPSRALQFFFFCWRFQPPQFLVAQLLHRGGKIWRVGFWKREQTAVEVSGGVAVVMCREVAAELSSSTGQP